MASNQVIQLTPDDFDEVEVWKLKNHKCCFVLFYVDWCKWCKAVKPTWNELANIVTFFDVASFDCDKYEEHINSIKSDVDGMIESYPTLVVYSNGDPVHIYKGERTLDKLIEKCMEACKLK